eukprot:COSAG02_NODE_1803_length_10885_cov_17.511033_2_plen_312_part_01
MHARHPGLQPECSVDVGPIEKSLATLLLPFVALVLVTVALVTKLCTRLMDVDGDGLELSEMKDFFLNTEDKMDHVRSQWSMLREEGISMMLAVFLLTSVAFLKATFGGVDCTRNMDGKRYLDIAPDVECRSDWFPGVINATISDMSAEWFTNPWKFTINNDLRGPDEPEYHSVREFFWLRYFALIGCIIYVVVFVTVVKAFAASGGSDRFAYLTQKMENQWSWWELWLLLRKILIMCIALFHDGKDSAMQGWYLASGVIVVSMAFHGIARPYKLGSLNVCEMASLFSQLVILQATQVWDSVKKDPRCQAIPL